MPEPHIFYEPFVGVVCFTLLEKINDATIRVKLSATGKETNIRFPNKITTLCSLRGLTVGTVYCVSNEPRKSGKYQWNELIFGLIE